MACQESCSPQSEFTASQGESEDCRKNWWTRGINGKVQVQVTATAGHVLIFTSSSQRFTHNGTHWSAVNWRSKTRQDLLITEVLKTFLRGNKFRPTSPKRAQVKAIWQHKLGGSTGTDHSNRQYCSLSIKCSQEDRNTRMVDIYILEPFY